MKMQATSSRKDEVQKRAPLRSPDALVQCAQLGHQFGGPFVLVATQVVNSFNSFRRGLQLVFVDAHSLVLSTHTHTLVRSGSPGAGGFSLQTPSLSRRSAVKLTATFCTHTGHGNSQAEGICGSGDSVLFL